MSTKSEKYLYEYKSGAKTIRVPLDRHLEFRLSKGRVPKGHIVKKGVRAS